MSLACPSHRGKSREPSCWFKKMRMCEQMTQVSELVKSVCNWISMCQCGWLARRTQWLLKLSWVVQPVASARVQTACWHGTDSRHCHCTACEKPAGLVQDTRQWLISGRCRAALPLSNSNHPGIHVTLWLICTPQVKHNCSSVPLGYYTWTYYSD